MRKPDSVVYGPLRAARAQLRELEAGSHAPTHEKDEDAEATPAVAVAAHDPEDANRITIRVLIAGCVALTVLLIAQAQRSMRRAPDPFTPVGWWDAWSRCTTEPACDFCALEPHPFLVTPNTGSRVVATSMHPGASRLFSVLVESATRISVASETDHASRWSSASFVMFRDARRVHGIRGFDPTHFVFVYGDPIRTILASVADEYGGAIDFASPEWRDRALRDAQTWAEQIVAVGRLLDEFGSDRVIGVRYEDLLASPEDVTAQIVEFARPAFGAAFPHQSKSRACVSRAVVQAATGSLMEPGPDVDVSAAFAEPLRGPLCDALHPAVVSIGASRTWVALREVCYLSAG